MRNKIIVLLIILFTITSCWKKDEENLDKKILNNSWKIVKNENIQENIDNDINVIENNENTWSIVNNEDSNETLKEDKIEYLKFEKLSNEDVLTYDCNIFKSYNYKEKCSKNKWVINFIETSNNWTKINEEKTKILSDWDLSYCEKFLKEKNDYWYFNCSLAVIIANDKWIKCDNIKNINIFKNYFWKTCDEMVLNINKYIEIEIAKSNYKDMLNSFWSFEERTENDDIEQIYINEIMRNDIEKELKNSSNKN